MRRLISTSTVLALLISLASPLLAEVCMKNGGRISCHRVSQAPAHHHCEGMPGHQHHQDEMLATDQDDSVTGVSATCPMNCCLAAHSGKNVAVANSIVIEPQRAVSAKLQFLAAAFITSGFSSHTDRGPPSL